MIIFFYFREREKEGREREGCIVYNIVFDYFVNRDENRRL